MQKNLFRLWISSHIFYDARLQQLSINKLEGRKNVSHGVVVVRVVWFPRRGHAHKPARSVAFLPFDILWSRAWRRRGERESFTYLSTLSPHLPRFWLTHICSLTRRDARWSVWLLLLLLPFGASSMNRPVTNDFTDSFWNIFFREKDSKLPLNRLWRNRANPREILSLSSSCSFIYKQMKRWRGEETGEAK